MKIAIKLVESKLGVRIKRNMKSVGVDTAQTSGIVFLKSDKDYIHIDGLVLNFKTANHKEIYGSMIRTFDKILEEDQFAVIEEVFVGFSRAGSVELAKYGAFCIAICELKGLNYETISATSARAKFKIDTRKCGKGKTKQSVALWLKETLNIEFTDNNLVDGFILALLGMIDGLDFRSQVDIKKDKKK